MPLLAAVYEISAKKKVKSKGCKARKTGLSEYRDQDLKSDDSVNLTFKGKEEAFH